VLRATYVAGVAVGATLLLAPLGIASYPFSRDGAFGFRLTRLWARWILRAAGTTVVVEGAGDADLPPGPVVFVANHVSVLDIPILFGWLPRPFRIVYKRSLQWIPVLGQFLVAARHVSVERSRAFSARRSLERAAARIHGGVSVALFPEGTRNADGRMSGFKRGSFKLAIESAVPVVPVALVGVAQLGPLARLRPGSVRLRVMPPVATDGRSAEDLASSVESAIQKEIDP
jgi:1-acyl-sn-glycerol-3-phosphate acyltransferase